MRRQDIINVPPPHQKKHSRNCSRPASHGRIPVTSLHGSPEKRWTEVDNTRLQNQDDEEEQFLRLVSRQGRYQYFCADAHARRMELHWSRMASQAFYLLDAGLVPDPDRASCQILTAPFTHRCCHMKHIAVVTTVGNLPEARSIARALVEQRLAACAQISKIESFYVWDDAVQNEQEFCVLCKTTDARYQAVEEMITKRHSYDLPAIHTFTLDCVYGPYASWIEKNCSES